MATNKARKPASMLEKVAAPVILDGDDFQDDAILTPDEQRFEVCRRDQIIREKDEEIERCKDEHNLRKRFLNYVFWFVVSFVVLTLAIVVWSDLSDKVLMTLLTTTTANIIGILLIAFKWLFPSRK